MTTSLDRHVISVSELNSIAKEALELMSFWVEGEITGYKPNDANRYYYTYFSLQDTTGKSVISCAIKRDAFSALNINLDNGQKVTVQGKMTMFTQSGRTAFLIEKIELTGQGKLAAELEKLKLKLQAEGLLSDERKRPLPLFPQKIGVVTSINSDAWADFLRHSVAKFPAMEIIVADSFVQGHRAPTSLVSAIRAMQKQPIEVLVVTRGGGSAEDLAAFNDERVVRAIAQSKIPTIVGVGHEKDISIADLVADVRASTPTNAGQIITKNYEDAVINLSHFHVAINRWSQQMLDKKYQQLDDLAIGLNRIQQKYQSLPYKLSEISSRLLHQHHRILENTSAKLDLLNSRQRAASHLLLERQDQKLQFANRQLQAISPLNILARGYSIVTSNNTIVRNSRQLKQGDTINIKFAHGAGRGLITKVEDEN